MKNWVIVSAVILALFLSVKSSYSQNQFSNRKYSNKDFVIKTSNLSKEYVTKFKDDKNVDILVSVFNQLKIPTDISPIVITISYEEGKGLVTAEINYNHEKIFSEYSDYKTHNTSILNYSYGTGISVYLQGQIFAALSDYKKNVATNLKTWTMDNDLLNFYSAVKLKKSNGDWIIFYAYNRLDRRGFYRYRFYNNARMQIKNKKYETQTDNIKALNDRKFFFLGKTVGIDGNRTGAYYFSEFFNIEID